MGGSTLFECCLISYLSISFTISISHLCFTDELSEFYTNLTKLIESTYAENGNLPVVIVAHSMGNPVMLYFYNHQPQAWKDKYLRAHVSLAGVWAGAVKTVRLMTSGKFSGILKNHGNIL